LETLGGCFVVERFAGSFVELSGDGAQLCLTVYRQIGAFGKVLAQEPVGVFVRATLPGALRIAQVDLDLRGQRKASVA
jgi:hypothetical protein